MDSFMLVPSGMSENDIYVKKRTYRPLFPIIIAVLIVFLITALTIILVLVFVQTDANGQRENKYIDQENLLNLTQKLLFQRLHLLNESVRTLTMNITELQNQMRNDVINNLIGNLYEQWSANNDRLTNIESKLSDQQNSSVHHIHQLVKAELWRQNWQSGGSCATVIRLPIGAGNLSMSDYEMNGWYTLFSKRYLFHNCTYQLQANHYDKKLKIIFNHVRFFAIGDYVNIYDGDDWTTAIPIRRLTGRPIVPIVIQSTKPIMTITMRSSDDLNSFRASYMTID